MSPPEYRDQDRLPAPWPVDEAHVDVAHMADSLEADGVSLDTLIDGCEEEAWGRAQLPDNWGCPMCWHPNDVEEEICASCRADLWRLSRRLTTAA
jgi:hypothetical protein